MVNIIKVQRQYNLIAKKKFGQNFLANDFFLNKIVEVPGDIKGKNILEIGPGLGGLTEIILNKNPERLVSIEIDKDLYSILKENFLNYKNFVLINEDAMKVEERNLFNNNINVIANLPYNIGTALVLKWLLHLELFESFTLLLQKEVVNRVVASPSTKDYGRLSIITQSFCNVKKKFDIPPTSFIPPPKVMSSVLYMTPKDIPSDVNFDKLSFITLRMFNQRRKKIKSCINDLISIKHLNPSVLDFMDLNKRAEDISVNEFIHISNFVIK